MKAAHYSLQKKYVLWQGHELQSVTTKLQSIGKAMCQDSECKDDHVLSVLHVIREFKLPTVLFLA